MPGLLRAKSTRRHQLCTNAAVSVIGPDIVIEAALFLPEYELVPMPVQLLKL